MKNFVQEGRTVTATAAADITGGSGMLIGSLFGVACGDASASEEVELQTVGVFDLTKAAVAVTVGDPMYWDDTAKVVTNVSTGNKLIGTAIAAALLAGSTARVRLRGAEDEHQGGVGAAVGDLTENAGAIGGTNDGDIPDLSSADAAANAAAVREVATKVNDLLAQLRAAGVIASA